MKGRNILVTGATGNVGMAVISHLQQLKKDINIIAGVRNIEKDKSRLRVFDNLLLRKFDIEDASCFDEALDGIDAVFLLRPPQIADVEQYFRPLVGKIKEKGIEQLVFLSVQGAGKSTFIPHNRIENLIVEYNINHIFVRPGYFMQNLTTTLSEDIKKKKKIILPAGKAKFNWIDVDNIGEASALLIANFEKHTNQAYDITGYENENFHKVAALIQEITGKKVSYKNTNPFRFYQIKRKEGHNKGLIFVMIMLHFLQRYQKEPPVSDVYEKLTGKNPTTLREFIHKHRDKF